MQLSDGDVYTCTAGSSHFPRFYRCRSPVSLLINPTENPQDPSPDLVADDDGGLQIIAFFER